MSITLAYHPCAKFSGDQVGASISESARACGLALVLTPTKDHCQGWHTAHIRSATLSLLCTITTDSLMHAHAHIEKHHGVACQRRK